MNFASKLEESGLEVVPRLTNEELWEHCFSQLQFRSFMLCSSLIKYYLDYMEDQSECVTDQSVIIFSGGKPAALWLLSGDVNAGKLRLTSSGQPILPPIFLPSVSNKLEGRIVSKALNVLVSIASTQAAAPLVIQQGCVGGSKVASISQWHRHAMNHVCSVAVRHEMYVDLTLSEAEFRSYMRQSYKPLIAKGLAEFDHIIFHVRNYSDQAWDEFRELHHKVAGRVTRSPATWSEQAVAIRSGKAFLVAIYAKEVSLMVGGALFHMTRDEGFYAVGAYDRALSKQPLGHIAQSIAIKYMRDQGLLWYKIGDRFFQHDTPRPSDKEVNISHFKEGFATTLLPRFEIALLNGELPE